MSRAITADELREAFMDHARMLAKYWAGPMASGTTEERCSGAIFSILTAIDGCTIGLPAFDLVARPHPEDKQYHIDSGKDWIEDGQVINGSSMLHELFYQHPSTGD